MEPNANGAPSQESQGPKLMSPAARKVSPRDLLLFLQNPDQVGYPATLDTDACLGFSVASYQAWEILYGSCGAAAFNPVRLSGPVARGHDAPKYTPTQRGKVGLCPCYVVATHVAVPGSYGFGPVIT